MLVDPRLKIQPIDRIQDIVTGRKAKGEKIVFTNGCFDLLHVGHTRYLQEARACGDCLLIGLNSDRSIRLIKGESRPILPQEQRAEVLAALECVDLVVVFDEPDPLRLISLVQPDILVKGADWGYDQIIGREVVEAGGGRVVRIPLVPDVSTTTIINLIRSRFGGNGERTLQGNAK
ncbi:MAG: D-glycero-beta-D-manno-heptose 1-phosphate adenylyltransferase [bacterium]